MSGLVESYRSDVPSASEEPGTDKVSLVECPCGQTWEVWKSGKGYEEFRQHLRYESTLLTGAQWVEAANRIKVASERARSVVER